MYYQHTKCGGTIDIKKKRCLKCKRKWNIISFYLDPSGIRPIPERADRKRKRAEVRSEATNWSKALQTSIPGVAKVVAILPGWPRWVRISVSVTMAIGLVILGLWLIGVIL